MYPEIATVAVFQLSVVLAVAFPVGVVVILKLRFDKEMSFGYDKVFVKTGSCLEPLVKVEDKRPSQRLKPNNEVFMVGGDVEPSGTLGSSGGLDKSFVVKPTVRVRSPLEGKLVYFIV
ncbi:MAG: hypothetical protein J6W10_03985 [Kiritimatiellae bacterium]|nr:hypothetical protein [Kiritimatiellia bacterium]